MANNIHLEGAGDVESWPPNVPGKATQVAVFGMYHPKKGKCCEILWTGQFPELQPAIYWGAKKEIEATRKGKWWIASRVVWQHELTPEQAVESVRLKMQPQVDDAIAQFRRGQMPTLKAMPGGVRPIDPNGNYDRLVEIEDPENPENTFSAVIPAKPDGK